MTEESIEQGKQALWYVRRKGPVKGPFPSGTIRRFLMLGRILLTDQVSRDKKRWQMVSEVPEMMPPEVRKALVEGNVEDLLPIRYREDERSGRERRTAQDNLKFADRRKGERRADEDEVLKRLREAKTALREEKAKGNKMPVAAALVIGLLVLLIVGYGVYIGAPEAPPAPDCAAAPAPGVNWRNCRLDGLSAESKDLSGAIINNAIMRDAKLSGTRFNESDLQYTDFTGADLSYAEMKGVLLKGAGLRNADLSYADLSGSDLSFADLRGANLGAARLDGVRFDHAIWINGAECAPGSVGRCLPVTR